MIQVRNKLALIFYEHVVVHRIGIFLQSHPCFLIGKEMEHGWHFEVAESSDLGNMCLVLTMN